jgi:hypothetical protein
MSWKGDAFIAEYVRDHLDWNNGTYWVRPKSEINPDSSDLTGKWAGGADHAHVRWTLRQESDGTVTSDGESGHAQGNLLSAGKFEINWGGTPTIKGTIQGDRIYWSNGSYWARK